VPNGDEAGAERVGIVDPGVDEGLTRRRPLRETSGTDGTVAHSGGIARLPGEYAKANKIRTTARLLFVGDVCPFCWDGPSSIYTPIR